MLHDFSSSECSLILTWSQLSACSWASDHEPHIIISFLSQRFEVYYVWVVNESAHNYHFNFIFVKLWYFVFDVLSCWPQCRLFRLLFYRDIDQIFLVQPKHAPLVKEGGVKKQPFNWIFPGSGYIACSLTGLYQTNRPKPGWLLFAWWVEPKSAWLCLFLCSGRTKDIGRLKGNCCISSVGECIVKIDSLSRGLLTEGYLHLMAEIC